MEITKPKLNEGDILPDIGENAYWDGKTGLLVEHYIKTHLEQNNNDIETLKSDVVQSINYQDELLYLYGSNNKLLAKGSVSVIKPTYDAEIHIIGIYQNDKLINAISESANKIIVNYKSENNYYLAVKVLKTASRIGGDPTYITAPIQCTLEVTGNASKPVLITPVSSLDDKPFLLDITDIISKTINSGITFKLTHLFTNEDAVLSKSGELSNVSITKPRITRTGSGYILTENSITFGIDGISADDSSDFVYEVFLDGLESSMNVTNVNLFTSLHSGINQILILAYNKYDRTISTGWEAFDFIYNDGTVSTTQVVVNNIPVDEIANLAVSNLCRVDIYSPNDENVDITAYVEENEPSSTTSFKTELSTLLITSDSYTDHMYTNQFAKYIELSKAGNNYLGIKVNNSFYSSGTITTTFFDSVWKNNYYTTTYWIIKVSKPDSTILPYTNGVGLNFSQSTSTSNNVFTGLVDLEVQEGYRLLNGKTVFYISSNANRDSIYASKYADTYMSRTNPFTLEVGLSSLNVSSEDGVLLSIGNIQIKPNEVCWKWDSVSDPDKKTYLNRNAGFDVDEETHIVITYTPSFKVSSGDIYYPDYLGNYLSNYKNDAEYALLKIYINGVVAREINLTDSDLATISNLLNISPKTSDVAISTLRTWSQLALTEALVRLNYIAFLGTVDEKKTEYKRNDILNQKGEISWSKAKEQYNTLVYIYPKGYNVLSRAYGGEDNQSNALESALKKVPVTLFINYADSEVNKIYGGRINKLQRKGLGSSAKRYLIWNVLDQTEKHKQIKYTDGKMTYKTSDKDSSGDAIYVTEDTSGVKFKTHEVETTYITGKDSDGKYQYLTCAVGSKIPNASKMKSEFVSYNNLDTLTNKFKEDAVVDTKGILLPNSSTNVDSDNIRIKKLVGKVNYASSMQSHKLGACELYNATNPTIINGRKAVKELPYLYFYYIADVDNIDNIELKELLDNDNKVKFMGLMTWGSGKCDKNTWDCDGDDVLIVEGAENEDLGANFRIPWHAYQRLNANDHLDMNPTTTKEECIADPLAKVKFYNESLFYIESSDMLNASWDFDTNVNDLGNGLDTSEAKISMEKFRLFSDFVYKWDPSYVVASDLTNARTDRKVCITNSTLSGFPNHKLYDLYRYDTLSKAWVPAGLYYSAGSWESLNLVNDLVKDEQGFNSRAGAEAWKDLVRLHFANNISDYVDITDVAHHLAVIKFLSGTDNRAKNTYFKVTNNNKIILYQDDMDTIFITDNLGKQSKAYNLLEPSYDESTSEYWGDSGLNIFFKTFDQCFESRIKNLLLTVCSQANTIIENYFYMVQKYFPAVSYNHTARIYYEIGLLIKNTGILHDGDNGPFFKSNGEEPITQSHGRYLEGEKHFINKRNIFLRSYSQQMTSSDNDIMLSETGGSGTSLNTYMRYTTFQDLYPLLYNRSEGGMNYLRLVDTTSKYDAIKYLQPKDKDFGQDSTNKDIFVHVTSTGASITMYLPMTDQYKTLHMLGFNRSKFLGVFSHLTELIIDLDAGLKLGIPKVTFSEITAKFPVIEKMSLIGITLPETLDFSTYEKLQELSLFNCSNVSEIKLPSTQALKTVTLPGSISKLSLIDLPNLSSVTVASWSNVKSLNLANIPNKLIQLILENLTSIPDNIVLGNNNHPVSDIYISEAVTNRILNANKLTIYGTLNIGESATKLTTISFNTSKKIYRKDLNDKFNYTKVSSFSGLQLTDVDINATEGTDLLNYLQTTYGNYITNVTASIKGVDVPRGLITSEMDEGTLSIRINNNAALTGYVRFTPKEPAVGDWAYIDGTFSSSYSSSKPIAGVVWWIDGDDVYVVHHKSIGKFVIGPDLGYNSSNYTKLENETNNGIFTWYANENNLKSILALKNNLDNISISNSSNNEYPVKLSSVSANNFVGRNNTNAVNEALIKNGYTYITDVNVDDLKSGDGFTMSNDILKCPYYQAAKLYDPTDGVTNANTCYGKGLWYIASYDEWLYIFTAFVASLQTSSSSMFSNKTAPNGYSVNSNLSTSLIVGNTVYPVFCKTDGHFEMNTDVYTSSLVTNSKMNSYVLDVNRYYSDNGYTKREGRLVDLGNWSYQLDWCLDTYELIPFVIYNKNGTKAIRQKYNV